MHGLRLVRLRGFDDVDAVEHDNEVDGKGDHDNIDRNGTGIDDNSRSSASGNDNNGYDNELRCVTYNDDTGLAIGNAQSIATGIIGFQVLYGESDGPSPVLGSEELKNVNRYVNATAVNDWNNVLSVRFSILTRSFSETPNNPDRRSFVLLDGEPYTFDDQIARYPLTITVDLPNKGWR